MFTAEAYWCRDGQADIQYEQTSSAYSFGAHSFVSIFRTCMLKNQTHNVWANFQKFQRIKNVSAAVRNQVLVSPGV